MHMTAKELARALVIGARVYDAETTEQIDSFVCSVVNALAEYEALQGRNKGAHSADVNELIEALSNYASYCAPSLRHDNSARDEAMQREYGAHIVAQLDRAIAETSANAPK